ncbi:YcaO-like family protein [Caminibacter pacificus]
MREFLEKLGVKTLFSYTKPTSNVYNVTLNAIDLPFVSFGKGESLDEALNSAYGEMCERILTRNFLEEYYINALYPDAIVTDKFLNEPLREFYKIDELEKEELLDFNSDVFDILSIPFTNPKTGEIVYFPINIVQNLYASNGMAFYSDLKTAYYNAKTEIIERFVKYEVIRYTLSIPKISHPLNDEFIQVYDATLGGKYPVMAVSFIKDNEIILSFGCDLDREKAIKKAYLELFQTELKKRGKLIDDDSVKDSFNLTKHFIDLSGDVHINFLKKPYFKEAKWDFDNLEVFKEDEYIKIYTTQNFYAVHLIIPQISEIYPIDDLIYHNINKGKFIRKDILQRQNKQKVIDYIYEHGAWDIGQFIGVIFDKKYTLENLDELYEGYEFGPEYQNILKLSKELNALR